MDKEQIEQIVKEYIKENMSISVRVRMENSMWGDNQIPSVEVEIYLDDLIICSCEG